MSKEEVFRFDFENDRVKIFYRLGTDAVSWSFPETEIFEMIRCFTQSNLLVYRNAGNLIQGAMVHE